jgi:hypothetical protein
MSKVFACRGHDRELSGRPGWLRRFLTIHLRPSRAARLLVLDGSGDPVQNAEGQIVGLGHCRANRHGYARFHLPGRDHYAVVVTSNGSEEMRYGETLGTVGTCVYRPDPPVCARRYFFLTDE